MIIDIYDTEIVEMSERCAQCQNFHNFSVTHIIVINNLTS